MTDNVMNELALDEEVEVGRAVFRTTLIHGGIWCGGTEFLSEANPVARKLVSYISISGQDRYLRSIPI